MRYRHSLRLRILLSYLAVGGLIAPLLAGFLLAAIYNLEEQLIGQHLQEELQQFMEQTRLKPELRREQRFKYLSAYVQDTDEPPAPALAFTAGLAPGVHELVHAGLDYQVAIAEHDGRRYTVIYDATEFEGWEVYLIAIVAGGTLLSVYIAVWLGYWLSRRLIAPVTSLAQRVAALGPEPLPRPLAEHYANDEVGELARAFDTYHRRLHAFVQRERDFTADASHELRNPLAVIQNTTELLLARSDLSEAVRTRLQRLERAIRDMHQTLSALLILAREPAGEAAPDAVTEVAAVVEDMLKTYGAFLAQPQVRVEPQLAARPRVAAPASVVAVLIGNLLRNAFSYTPQGRIAIHLDRQRLVIEDTGIGIPEADLEQVFQRGFRGQGAPGTGSGLGLSIASRICERYGWGLGIHSRPGSGTRVEWTFTPLTKI